MARGHAEAARRVAATFFVLTLLPLAVIVFFRLRPAVRLDPSWMAAILVLVLLFVGWRYRRLAAKNERLARLDGVLLQAGPQGLAYLGEPTTPWGELVGGMVSDSRSADGERRLQRGLNGWRYRAWAQAGHGSVLLWVGYRDVEPMKGGLSPDQAKDLSWGAKGLDGTRIATVETHLDALLDRATIDATLNTLREYFAAHGLAWEVHDTEAELQRASIKYVSPRAS